MISYINKGTYNQVYNVIDLDSSINYAYRFSNFKFTDISYLINNFIEFRKAFIVKDLIKLRFYSHKFKGSFLYILLFM